MYPGFAPPKSGFWLFAYGSLMWQPDFRFAERRRAVLRGHHRALCVYSWHYRGTVEEPGLVFGLDRGGHTKGIAFRIGAHNARRVFKQVYAREMISNVYRPAWVACKLTDGPQRTVTALAFLADPKSPQYAGRLSPLDIRRMVNDARGSAGPCADYVRNTALHLRELGIRDRALENISARL